MAPAKSFQKSINIGMKMMKKILEDPEQEPLITAINDDEDGATEARRAAFGTTEEAQTTDQTLNTAPEAPKDVVKQHNPFTSQGHDHGTRLSIDSNIASEMSSVDIDEIGNPETITPRTLPLDRRFTALLFIASVVLLFSCFLLITQVVMIAVKYINE